MHFTVEIFVVGPLFSSFQIIPLRDFEHGLYGLVYQIKKIVTTRNNNKQVYREY